VLGNRRWEIARKEKFMRFCANWILWTVTLGLVLFFVLGDRINDASLVAFIIGFVSVAILICWPMPFVVRRKRAVFRAVREEVVKMQEGQPGE